MIYKAPKFQKESGCESGIRPLCFALIKRKICYNQQFSGYSALEVFLLDCAI